MTDFRNLNMLEIKFKQLLKELTTVDATSYDLKMW